MKKTITFFRLLPVILLALLLTGNGVSAQTITITQTSTGITSNSYDSGAEKTWTQSTVDLGAKAVMKQSGQAALQFQASNGVIYNTNEMPGKITSVKVTQTGTARPCNVYGYTARIVNSNTADYSINSIATLMGTTTTSTSTITFTGSNKYFALKVPNNATYISEIVITYEAGTPEIALADNGTQVAAADVSQGTAAVVLHKFQLGVTSASASLTGMTCTTSGTYAAADITNLKVRYSADATLDGADETLSTFTNPGAAGSKTFPSFTSRSIASGTTGYIFITADVAATATHNNTIAVDAITTDNLTFSSGNKTGSTTAGGAQTFKDVTAPTVTTYSPADGNTAVTVNQNLVLTFSENIAKGTGNITIKKITGDAVVQTIDIASASVTISGTTLTIDPPADLILGTQYYVNIDATAIKDNVGNAYAGIANNTTWNFTTVAPSVTNVTSSNADGTYKVGDVITVTVTFNENVVVTGTPYILLKMVGTNRQAAYALGSGTNTLTFSYTLQDTDAASDLDYVATNSLYVGSGTINSADGVAVTRTLASPGAAGSLGYNKDIVVDCVKPTVSSYNPTDGNTAVTINQNLVLTFNENVKRGASGSIVIYTTGATVFETIPYDDSRIAFSSNTVTINPEGTFAYSSDYYVQTTGNPISDMYDNNYAGISNTTTWNFTTECGPVGLPYSQDFTTYLPNTCWTEKTGLLEAPSTLTGTSSAWSADGFANNGSTGSAGINIFGTAKKEWLITPTIDLGSSTDYQLEFDLALTDYGNANAITTDANGTTGTDDKFAVVISTDNGATWTSANTLRIWNNSGSSDVYNNLTPAGTHVTISLADYTGLVKIGFYGESTVSNADNDLFIDNLSVVQLATCITPTVVASSDVTAISATISWVASSSNPANGYQYELRTSGAAGSGATGLVTSGTTAAGVVSKAITDLVPNTAYNVFVRSDCGAGDFSAWTNVYSFSTPNLAAPTATAATAISTTSFTANWGAVASATGYELDVYQGGDMLNEDFSSISTGNSTSTSGSSTAWTGNTNFPTSSIVTAYQAGGAVKIGSGSAVGSITTKELNLSSGATLTFDVKGWTTVEGNISVTVNGANAQTVSYTATISDAFETKTLSIAPNTPTSTITIATSAKRAFIDNVVISNKTSVSGSPFTVTETTKAVTSLTANSAYYYAVVAKNGDATSASSNVISVSTSSNIPVSSGSTNASDLPNCPTCDVTVATGGTLTLNVSRTYNSVTVAPGAKLTLQNGNTFSPGTFVLQSSESGTATFVDERTGTTPYISATVQQYLPQGRNWYVGIPIVSGSAGTLTAAGLSTSVSYWNEAASAWVNSYTETLTPGVGYIGVSAAGSGTNNVSFTGNLNTGNINVALTRKGTSSIGYNLVANPYPSYLNAMAAINANANVQKTIWYRTRSTGQTPLYKFETVNTTSGEGTNAAGTGVVTGYVPPMQAFWVRTLTDNNTITFTNEMRYHANPTVDTVTIQTTPLKAPSNTGNKLVRLEVAKGSATDETVIYFHPNAATGFDDYDSPKRSNESVAIPELYTIASAETLAINGLPEIVYNTELPLGFNAGAESVYSIRAKELRNLDADVRVILKDGAVEYDLTNGDAYEFSSAVYNSANRFSIIFRSSGTVSGIDNTALNTSTHVFVNANGELMVKTSAPLSADARVAVFNAVGQQISIQALRTGTTSFKFAPTAGMYLVKITSNGATITRRVMVN